MSTYASFESTSLQSDIRKRALELEHVHVPEIAIPHTIVDTREARTSHFYAPTGMCSDQSWLENTLQSGFLHQFT